MGTIGIDLASRKSHICIRDNEANIIEERVIATSDLDSWFAQDVEKGSTVVLETCNEAFHIANQAQLAGLNVQVVPASVVRQLGVGYRGIKNDVRDARVLSRASISLGAQLPQVHIPSASSQSAHRLLTERSCLVRVRTALSNGIKAQLRAQLIALPSGSMSTLTRRVRKAIANNALLPTLEPVLCVFEATHQSIVEFEKQLDALFKDDEQMKLLRSVPGVGLLVAATWLSSVDELSRFDNASQLASYIGLTPGENSSGGKTRLTSITRAGKGPLRALLVQSSWVHIQQQRKTGRSTALSDTYDRLVQHKPPQVAIVAVARKLVKVLFAILRDQKPYDSSTNQTQNTSATAEQVAVALAS